MSANDMQVGGEHYRGMKIQPWDFMEATLTPEEFRGFLKGCTIKYISRRKADALLDLKKARHCLDKLIEIMEKV